MIAIAIAIDGLAVVTAVKALVKLALPGADVIGLDNRAAKPASIAPMGRAIVRYGDPGEPEIDLSPVTYHYEHGIPVELVLPPGGDHVAMTAEALGAIGAAIEADRFLGGLCSYLDATAPAIDDITGEGTGVAGGAQLLIVASYATTKPL